MRISLSKSEQLAALVIVNQPKKCQQILQFVEEEEYGLRDEKNEIEKVNSFKMPDLYRTCSTRQIGVSIIQSHAHIKSIVKIFLKDCKVQSQC